MIDIKVREAIVGEIQNVLRQVDPEADQLTESTLLCGAGAVLDSVGFVNFLVTLEQALGQRVDLSALFIEHAGEPERDSPFHTIGSLADLILRA